MTCSNIFIYLCPGYHSPQLTEKFVNAVWAEPPNNLIIFPSDRLPPYSPEAVLQYLRQGIAQKSPSKQPISTLWICFSAGVVGGILAARRWHRDGKGSIADQQVNASAAQREANPCQVSQFIAIDGWGVPLGGAFPLYRMSHDLCTHRSHALMGDRPVASFIAHPAVDHLQLWRSPNTVTGYISKSSPPDSPPITAAHCIKSWIESET
ncbi:MAG: hypothetical protein ACFCBU_13095 [Cyanophyceae cyanobacterium]